MEGAKSCMNAACGASVAGDGWKKGWALRSGGFAVLCNTCGLAYEQHFFCDAFHSKETGWRECSSCHKRLHCGCIVSTSFLELLDGGGVQCLSCKNNSEPSMPMEVPQDSPAKGSCDEEAHLIASEMNIFQPHTTDPVVNKITVGGDKTSVIDKSFDVSGPCTSKGLIEPSKQEHLLIGAGSLVNANFTGVNQGPQGSFILGCGGTKDEVSNKASEDALPRGILDISLGTSLPQNLMEGGHNARSSQDMISLSKAAHEVKEHDRASVIQQWQRSRCLLPKPSRMNLILDTAKDMLPHMRVARPPAEGRGRAQLLPRYWPRITDQELRQISGDSTSTIVPLFEKVLSASDAGRIGRLVLPKACAEAYFPLISQPEGLPLKIQDAKGKDWVFQFRYWPNNNSRMYVLEGVTPCIQSMQLQAGDTVTFSRIDPEGKLVMGFRKATNTVSLQDSQISAIANGSFGTENILSGVVENLPTQNLGVQGHKSIDGVKIPHFPVPEKKSQNIGPKRKRLHIDNEDAMELKMTWDEAQDLLRPPPSIKPSIVMVEEYEFEEYEEPPVFGKKSVFTSRITGELDQWVQCDICSKWRRLPSDVFLSSTWTCSENLWDTKRSCVDPEEMGPTEIHNLLQQNSDFRKQKIAASRASLSPEEEAPGLDALATTTSLGDNASPSTSSVAPTTKHPRHRQGCTCIVCIQPPSGKGPKHQPTCTCNVCSTVRRRFKTLMMRKKKRQSEREEAELQRKLTWDKKEAGEDNSLGDTSPIDLRHDIETGQDAILMEMGKGKIDLNFNPKRGEGSGLSHASMTRLLQVANLPPVDACIKQCGVTSLGCDQHLSWSSPVMPEVVLGETEHGMLDESAAAFASREDAGADGERRGSDPTCNDAG